MRWVGARRVPEPVSPHLEGGLAAAGRVPGAGHGGGCNGAAGREQPAPHPELEAFWRASSELRSESGELRYRCQVTELARATSPLSWGDPRHYLRDLLYGNARPAVLGRVVALALFNAVQRRRGGVLFPYYENTGEKKSPHAELHLQPGETVRVRTKHEIEQTLTLQRRNRGLWFDGEMLRWCGGVFRVSERVDHLIKERTGEMIDVSNPLVVLDGVAATGEYLALNPQHDIVMWREIWLERVTSEKPTAGKDVEPMPNGDGTGTSMDDHTSHDGEV